MAEPHPRPPSFPPQVPAETTHTSGIPNFPDTFFGTNDKRYVDRKVRDVSRLRGVDVFYYAMLDQTQRIDGTKPLTDGKEYVPEITTRKRGGNVSLYGEPVIVRHRIDSTKREVIPDWHFAEPVMVRGLVTKTEQDEEPDERGLIFIRTATLDIGRVLMEDLKLIPHAGDVVRLPKLLDSFYDVKRVFTDGSRFGATGFFSVYTFELERKTMFVPERKLTGGT